MQNASVEERLREFEELQDKIRTSDEYKDLRELGKYVEFSRLKAFEWYSDGIRINWGRGGSGDYYFMKGVVNAGALRFDDEIGREGINTCLNNLCRGVVFFTSDYKTGNLEIEALEHVLDTIKSSGRENYRAKEKELLVTVEKMYKKNADSGFSPRDCDQEDVSRAVKALFAFLHGENRLFTDEETWDDKECGVSIKEARQNISKLTAEALDEIIGLVREQLVLFKQRGASKSEELSKSLGERADKTDGSPTITKSEFAPDRSNVAGEKKEKGADFRSRVVGEQKESVGSSSKDGKESELSDDTGELGVKRYGNALSTTIAELKDSGKKGMVDRYAEKDSSKESGAGWKK